MTDMVISDADEARFWSKIDRSGPNGCWLWTGWLTKQGYGRFDLGSRKVLATHVSLQLSGQPRPSPTHFALHGDLCTPTCCNPQHIRWGTPKENAEDRERLGRRVNAIRGATHKLAKLDEDLIRYIRSSPLTQKAVADEVGVSQALVSKIRRREVWTHVA